MEECRKTLIHFDVRELTPSSVAEVIGMMARTPTELVDPIPIQVCILFQLIKIILMDVFLPL